MEDKLHFKKMGREFALQFLYQQEIQEEDLNCEKGLNKFWDQLEGSECFPQNRFMRKGKEFAERLIYGYCENSKKIDSIIKANLDNWEFDRISSVNKNIMRISTYEMIFCDDIPNVVSIKEAVNIAVEFSDDKSRSFINGMLNSIKNSLEEK